MSYADILKHVKVDHNLKALMMNEKGNLMLRTKESDESKAEGLHSQVKSLLSMRAQKYLSPF